MMTSDFRHTHPLRGLRPVVVVAMAVLWILFPAALGFAAQQTLHHALEVEILHDAKTLRGIDTILPVAGTDTETVVRTARKITHYGRYGRLSFKGGVNIGKGVGEVSGSPLVVDLGDNS